MSIPISQFVLKIHSRCDLSCDHCYVYEGADQSWRRRPPAMTDEVITQSARRIAEHARAHQLPVAHVVLHGGEPLLAGVPRLRTAIVALSAALEDTCDLDLRIHTNGVRLNREFCELFAEHNVRVGISIDGGRAANDRHRRYADGRSSYAQVTQAIDLLRTRFPQLYAGLLCTIDVTNDPVQVYESLAALGPPSVDFLLPHATWATPPGRPNGQPAPYADWLIAIFDRWQADGRPMQVRTFDSIIATSQGGDSLTEALGLGPASLVVIETDGEYEQVDSLKTAFDGAPATGFNVFEHDLDTVARHPGIAIRQQGAAGLCRTCQECPVVTSCGGGLYAHRYKPGAGFANPSVYCYDLLKFITHVRQELSPVLPDSDPADSRHLLLRSQFDELATGFGGPSAMRALTEAQASLRRQRLADVHHAGRDALLPGWASAGLTAAWDVLMRADRGHRAELNAVLAHPYVRAWAIRCLGRLEPGAWPHQGGATRPLPVDLAHLGAIAAATALRSGLDARMTVPVVDGAIHLPTLGRLPIAPAGSRFPGPPRPRASDPALARVEIAGGFVTFLAGRMQRTLPAADLLDGRSSDSDESGPSWEPVRHLRAPGISVALEDTDPYRDCHQWAPAPRLGNTEVLRWQQLFRSAWQEIMAHHSGYGAGLAAGLTTIVPLAPAPAGREVSATARQAFGAVAIALPAGATALAQLLVHEFQHVKLGAVLDMYQLYDPKDHRLYHAPWRDDPRPLEGLLQGTYAHLAVTSFWQSRLDAPSVTGRAAEEARQKFQFWQPRAQSSVALLEESGSLTGPGTEFVSRMREFIDSIPAGELAAGQPQRLP